MAKPIQKAKIKKEAFSRRSFISLITANPYRRDTHYAQFRASMDHGRSYSRAKAFSVQYNGADGETHDTIMVLSPQAAYLITDARLKKDEDFVPGFAIVKSQYPNQLRKAFLEREEGKPSIFSQEEINHLFDPVAGFYENEIVMHHTNTYDNFLVSSRLREAIEQDILDNSRYSRKHGAFLKDGSKIYRSASSVLWVEKDDKVKSGYKFHFYSNPSFGETSLFMNDASLRSKRFRVLFRMMSIGFQPPKQPDGSVKKMSEKEADFFARETLAKCAQEIMRSQDPYNLTVPSRESLEAYLMDASITRHLEKATQYLAKKVKNPRLKKSIAENGLHETTCKVFAFATNKIVGGAYSIYKFPLRFTQGISHTVSNINWKGLGLSLGVGSLFIAATTDQEALLAAGGFRTRLMPKITGLFKKNMRRFFPPKPQVSIEKAANVAYVLTCDPALNFYKPDGARMSLNARYIPIMKPVDLKHMPHIFKDIQPLSDEHLQQWAQNRLYNSYGFQPGTVFEVSPDKPLAIECLEPSGIRVIRNTEAASAVAFRAEPPLTSSDEEMPVRQIMDEAEDADCKYVLLKVEPDGKLSHSNHKTLADIDLVEVSKLTPLPESQNVKRVRSFRCDMTVFERYPFELEPSLKAAHKVQKRARTQFKKYVKAACKGKILDKKEDVPRNIRDNLEELYGDPECCKSYFRRVADGVSDDGHVLKLEATGQVREVPKGFHVS